MEFRSVLNELLRIAAVPKADYAEHLGLSASGISKLISSQRLPATYTKKRFIELSAAFFAEHIYGPNCHFKMFDYWPFIIDFKSKYELQSFLKQLLIYYYDKISLADFHANQDRAVTYSGTGQILFSTCIIISDGLADGNQFDIYNSSPIFQDRHLHAFSRLRISPKLREKNIHFNFLYDLSQPIPTTATTQEDLMGLLRSAEQAFHFDFWSIQVISEFFVLLKGKFCLQYHAFLDGSPVMTVVHDKPTLATYLDVISKSILQKQAFCLQEIHRELHEPKTAQLLEVIKQATDVFNFAPIGYLLYPEEVDNLTAPQVLKERINEFIGRIVQGKVNFYINSPSLFQFLTEGDLTVPLVGRTSIKRSERVNYLMRFNLYLENPDLNAYIIDVAITSLVIFLSPVGCLFCAHYPELDLEKIYFLPPGDLTNQVYGFFTSSADKFLRVTPDLWSGFQETIKQYI